jgi:hypothetical protein
MNEQAVSVYNEEGIEIFALDFNKYKGRVSIDRKDGSKVIFETQEAETIEEVKEFAGFIQIEAREILG